MYIPNDDTQNYLFSRFKLEVETFNTQPCDSTNQNSQKSLILLSRRIRKCYYTTLGTSLINS